MKGALGLLLKTRKTFAVAELGGPPETRNRKESATGEYHVHDVHAKKGKRYNGLQRGADTLLISSHTNTTRSHFQHLILIPPLPTEHYNNMVEGVKIHSQVAPEAQAQILTEDALKFLAALHRTFDSTRHSLLTARENVQLRLDSGFSLDFLPETAHIRADPSWQCAPPAPGLEDRRVEITGPTDRKMVINALNSGAKTFMADLEGM